MTKAELKDRHLSLKAKIELASLDFHPEEGAKAKMESLIEHWQMDDSAESHNFLVRLMGRC